VLHRFFSLFSSSHPLLPLGSWLWPPEARSHQDPTAQHWAVLQPGVTHVVTNNTLHRICKSTFSLMHAAFMHAPHSQ